MSGNILTLAGVLGAALLTLIGVGIKNRADSMSVLLKAYQEERRENGARLEKLEARELVRDDYIGALRQHIYDGKPPPPPPWPTSLTGYAPEPRQPAEAA